MNLIKKAFNAIEKVNLTDVKIYDLENKNPFYNYVVVATGTSRQSTALLGYLKEEMKNAYEVKGIEGKSSGWLLVDLSELVIHVFDEEMREYYKFDERFINVKEVTVKWFTHNNN